MSFREKLFVDKLASKLIQDSKITVERIFRKRRSTFWGETPVLFRVRKYKVAGEIRNERVSVVKPRFHNVRLYSKMMDQSVQLQTTPQMLKYIEASGGLDDYLLNTPDEKLMSDVASRLKVQLMQMQQAGTSAQYKKDGQRRQKQNTVELAKIHQTRDLLATERRERITRMLQAAADTATSGAGS